MMVVIDDSGHLFPIMVTGSVVISDGGHSILLVKLLVYYVC